VSVAILIQLRSPERSPILLPLATEGVFARYWLPAADRLGLRWMPRFESGATVSLAELPEVLAELAAVRADFARTAAPASVMERVDYLIRALGEVDWAEVAEIFIG